MSSPFAIFSSDFILFNFFPTQKIDPAAPLAARLLEKTARNGFYFLPLKRDISTGGVIGGTANRYGESCVYINCRHLLGRLDLCVVSTNFRVVSLFTFGVETREMVTF